MSLPLQPGLHPWPPWASRLALLLALALAVLVIGCLPRAQRTSPRLILDGPGSHGGYARALVDLIDGSHERCWVAMYVVRPQDDVIGGVIDALARAQRRGVDVRVMLDQETRPERHPDGKELKAVERLRELGLRVVLDEGDVTSHVKLVTVDGRFVLSGSHNWTRSALVENREASWLVEDPDLAHQAEDWLRKVPGWDQP